MSVKDTSKVKGLYLGILEDNIDPLAMGRIRIRIPELHGHRNAAKFIPDDALPWALPCFTDTGEYRIPKKDTLIWCLAQHEDMDNWVWMGVCPSRINKDSIFKGLGDRSTVPTQSKDSLNVTKKDPQVIEFKSPSGHYIVMDDAKDREQIELRTKSNHAMRLSDIASDPKIDIRTNAGHFIEMDDILNGQKINIHTNAGHNILLDDTTNATKLKVTDKSGNSIEMNSETNDLTITMGGQGTININGGNLVFNVTAGDVNVINSGKVSLGAAGKAPGSGVCTGTTFPLCLVTGSPISHSSNVGAKD